MPSYAENLKFQADKAREPITTTITEKQDINPAMILALLSQILGMFPGKPGQQPPVGNKKLKANPNIDLFGAGGSGGVQSGAPMGPAGGLNALAPGLDPMQLQRVMALLRQLSGGSGPGIF